MFERNAVAYFVGQQSVDAINVDEGKELFTVTGYLYLALDYIARLKAKLSNLCGRNVDVVG